MWPHPSCSTTGSWAAQEPLLIVYDTRFLAFSPDNVQS